jgi:hypothetical protein
MQKTDKNVTIEYEYPIVDGDDHVVTIIIDEYGRRLDTISDAEKKVQGWSDHIIHDLGKCRFIDHRDIEAKIDQFIRTHPNRLTDDEIIHLRNIVNTSSASLFELDVTTRIPSAAKKLSKRSKKPSQAESTLKLNLTLNESEIETSDEEFRLRCRQHFIELTLENLRNLATGLTEIPSTVPDSRKAYYRSQAVRTYVQLRARGYCEGCDQPAPFINSEGLPYLESHHTIRVADGGPDHPHWVIALCPSCHRHAHHAHDAREFNANLLRIVNSIEPKPIKQPI